MKRHLLYLILLLSLVLMGCTEGTIAPDSTTILIPPVSPAIFESGMQVIEFDQFHIKEMNAFLSSNITVIRIDTYTLVACRKWTIFYNR